MITTIVLEPITLNFEIYLVTRQDGFIKHSVCGQFPTSYDALIALPAFAATFGGENVYIRAITEAGRNLFGEFPRSAEFIASAASVSPNAAGILATKG